MVSNNFHREDGGLDKILQLKSRMNSGTRPMRKSRSSGGNA